MTASRFRNRGQSLKPTVHSRRRTCDGRRAGDAKDRDAYAEFEGQSLELFVHRGVA